VKRGGGERKRFKDERAEFEGSLVVIPHRLTKLTLTQQKALCTVIKKGRNPERVSMDGKRGGQLGHRKYESGVPRERSTGGSQSPHREELLREGKTHRSQMNYSLALGHGGQKKRKKGGGGTNDPQKKKKKKKKKKKRIWKKNAWMGSLKSPQTEAKREIRQAWAVFDLCILESKPKGSTGGESIPRKRGG